MQVIQKGRNKCLLCNICRSHERTTDDLETIYEELLHIRALSHLSNSIKRELASVMVFEAHARAGTVCKYRTQSVTFSLLAKFNVREASNKHLCVPYIIACLIC